MSQISMFSSEEHQPDSTDILYLVEEVRQQTSNVNIVSFSGGKDSTVVLQLVMAALAGTDKKLYIVTSDTLMEIPYFQDYVSEVKKRIMAYISREKVNAEVVTVVPQVKDSFWVSVLGKGYPAAHMGFRWCTGKLKIDPITKYIRTVICGEDYTVFVGVRRAESDLRAKIYQQRNYKPNHYAPILHWTAHDVWDFLLTEPCPWGDHSKLIEVYRYSSDECVYGEKQGVCVGNARYGCWACPLQKTTQLDMIGLNTGDNRYEELKRYKNIISGMANNRSYRSRIRRNGEEGLGPFLVGVRRSLFDDLKKLEKKTGWALITVEEEKLIHEHWEEDKDIHNVGDNKQPMLWQPEFCK